MENVRQKLPKAYVDVRVRMKVQRRQKDYYDKCISGKPYVKGDQLVCLYVPCAEQTPSRKLYQPLSEPYRMVERLSDSVYRIQLVGGRKRIVMQFNRLKP